MKTVLTRPTATRAPGLVIAAAGVGLAWLIHLLVPAIPALTAAVVLGICVAHVPSACAIGRPGLSFASRRFMRLGIVLLGLELSLSDVIGLGWASVAMVFAVVVITFAGTWWLGRKLGLPGDQPLLIATGYSICGASAIGSVSEVTRSDERDIATSAALVTLCGTLAIAVLPLLRVPLGLDDVAFGRWVGASVHDVGQVVATAGTAGAAALSAAVLVKLMRVALLAPTVAAVALVARRSADTVGKRPPLVPLFVVGFLAMVVVRSTGLLPEAVLGAAHVGQQILLTAALFGLGSSVRLPALASTGFRVAALGLSSWVLIAAASYAGVLLTM